MANCWRCGGEMSPYAVRCNWCGRSTTVSAFFQVLTIGVLIAAALVVGGVVPLDAVTRYLPAELLKDPRPEQRATAPSRATGSGEAVGGYAATETRAAAENRRRERSRADEEADRRRQAARQTRQASAATESRCDSEDRVNALASRYDTWTAADLSLIACRRVRVGFSREQLIASRGRPLSEDSSGQVWVYRDIRVVLNADVVTAVHEP